MHPNLGARSLTASPQASVDRIRNADSFCDYSGCSFLLNLIVLGLDHEAIVCLLGNLGSNQNS